MTLTIDLKSVTFIFGFDFKDQNLFNELVQYMNKFWIRQDFFKRYQTNEQIGKGGFASVSVATRIEDKRLFAAKVIKKDRICKDKERLYFLNELRISRIVDHPLLVKTYEVHELKNEFVVVQDFIEGVNLSQYIRIKKKLNEPVAIYVVHQLLTAIFYLHKLGTIHRDIKPQNIMLKVMRDEKKLDFKEKYEVILIDFGLCADYRDFSPTSFLHDKSGTTGYLAPEVIKNNKAFYDDKVDVFSIGVVLVEMYSFLTQGNRQESIQSIRQ